tara:strand:- start:1203 stop:1535 length:333 start_codon:yes stop_codon:yes gene_type:complete
MTISITKKNTIVYHDCLAIVENAKLSVSKEQAYIDKYELAYKSIVRPSLRVSRNGRVFHQPSSRVNFTWCENAGDDLKSLRFEWRHTPGISWYKKPEQTPRDGVICISIK